jgi:hypothetical protein
MKFLGWFVQVLKKGVWVLSKGKKVPIGVYYGGGGEYEDHTLPLGC